MCNNPKLDLVNMNAYINFGEILFICSQDIERKRNFGVNQGPLLWYKCAKMMCSNAKLDNVNMNAHTKIGGTLFICSQDIKRKRNCCVNQGP